MNAADGHLLQRAQGRDALFKRGMRHFFPNTVRRYEAEYGIKLSAGST